MLIDSLKNCRDLPPIHYQSLSSHLYTLCKPSHNPRIRNNRGFSAIARKGRLKCNCETHLLKIATERLEKEESVFEFLMWVRVATRPTSRATHSYPIMFWLWDPTPPPPPTDSFTHGSLLLLKQTKFPELTNVGPLRLSAFTLNLNVLHPRLRPISTITEKAYTP